jgi:hypothetical protein
VWTRVVFGEEEIEMRTIGRSCRRAVVAALLGTAAGGALLSACSSMPQGPTYTEAELQASCERRGGWWRGGLIPGYCEFQSASLTEAP